MRVNSDRPETKSCYDLYTYLKINKHIPMLILQPPLTKASIPQPPSTNASTPQPPPSTNFSRASFNPFPIIIQKTKNKKNPHPGRLIPLAPFPI